MRTITTREQLLINGRVHERIATHIVTGAGDAANLLI